MIKMKTINVNLIQLLFIVHSKEILNTIRMVIVKKRQHYLKRIAQNSLCLSKSIVRFQMLSNPMKGRSFCLAQQLSGINDGVDWGQLRCFVVIMYSSHC